MKYRKSRSPAFTLIELLVVIAIIAVLAVVVILTLNPADLLRQARDSNRLSDLSTLNSAIEHYSADLAGSGNLSLGTPGVTYLSIPDPTATTTAGTDCSGLGFPSGTALHCPASSTFRNVDGTGWLPIDFAKMSTGIPFGTLPVDPSNQTSTNLYYSYSTDGTAFKLMAIPESEKYVAETGKNPLLFSTGSKLGLDGGSWVLVPGNPTFGTHNFYVMKYAAGCSDGEGNYVNTPVNSYSGGYAGSCTSSNGLYVAALAGGLPVVDLTQVQALSACQAVGAHLMTNNEWQTVAWNAEGVAANWSGASVGSGYIYSGHDDGSPNVIEPASPDDMQGYFGTDGPASGGGSGSNSTQKRTLTLSNGSFVWDMGGNVGEWMSDTIRDEDEPNGGGGFSWREFTAITNWGTMSQQAAGPSNPTWNSAQGMGKIASDGTAGDATLYGFIRGLGYAGGQVSGIEGLSLSNDTNSQGYWLGFRCAK